MKEEKEIAGVLRGFDDFFSKIIFIIIYLIFNYIFIISFKNRHSFR